MSILYIPNPTQFLNLNSLITNKQQIIFIEAKVAVDSYLIDWTEP